MKRSRVLLCAAAFALVCAAAISFFSRFTDVDTPLLGYMDWTACEIVDANGAARPVDLGAPPPWDWQPGETLRFTGVLLDAETGQALYQNYGYLILDCRGLELTVLVDGTEYAHVRCPDRGQTPDIDQLRLPLTLADAGKKLELRCVPLASSSVQYPLIARFSSQSAENAFSAAFNDRTALPAGACALGFVLLCAIFLAGLAGGAPDISLPLLAAAAAFTAVWELCQSAGTYFLPAGINRLLTARWAPLIPAGMLLAYLLLNRRRAFWRLFWRASLGMLAGAAMCYAYSGMTDRHFFSDINSTLAFAAGGDPFALLAGLNIFLLAVCGGIAANSLLQTTARARSAAQAMAVRQGMLLESYRNMERSLQGTAVMRHEWKNRIANLHLLAEQKDLKGLEQALVQLDTQLDKLSQQRYSKHFMADVILRNAAARCAEAQIRFSAAAPLPETLSLDSADLCSLLINMLDNAVAAAARAPEGQRRVSASLKLNRGFLAVKCENSYAGTIRTDAHGVPVSTGTPHEEHGYGIRQMRQIAEKYGGTLELSWTGDTFTAQTALQLP